MFDLKIIEVALGVIFIYFLFSLLATTINENVMRFFYSRGKNLKRAIIRMLNDQPVKKQQTHGKKPIQSVSLVDEFYKHPLIEKFANTSPKKWLSKGNMPSYIADKNFSRVLLEVLSDNEEIDTNFNLIESKVKAFFPDKDSSTRKLLLTFTKNAKGDLQKLKADLENWYESMMERAMGWYKRRVQVFLFIIGFITCMIFNADTIQITKTLSNNPDARAAVVNMAQQYYDEIKSREQSDSTDKKNADIVNLQSLSDSLLHAEYQKLVSQDIPAVSSVLGMGWNYPATAKTFWDKVWFIISSIPSHILGWLITAFAITLGAPFWFDMLGKVSNIRNTGTKPGEKDAQPEKPVG